MLEAALRGGQGLTKLKTVESGSGNTDPKQYSADATANTPELHQVQEVTV